jgi:hypothetical protein
MASAGCHGSGKTALTAQFRDMGFTVMDEGFMSQPVTLLHPQVRELENRGCLEEAATQGFNARAQVSCIAPVVQSLLMETTWVCAWFTRLMSHISGCKARGEDMSHKVICTPDPVEVSRVATRHFTLSYSTVQS